MVHKNYTFDTNTAHGLEPNEHTVRGGRMVNPNYTLDTNTSHVFGPNEHTLVE